MPAEIALEPGLFIQSGGDFPHVHAAATGQDQKYGNQVNHGGYKNNFEHYNGW
jgi:hypothetical protein